MVTLGEMEKRTGFGWKSGLNMTAQIANISVKAVAIISMLWTFGGAVVNGGIMKINMNAYGEMWFEIGLFAVLFALALYHEVRVSKNRKVLLTAMLFIAVVSAVLFALGPKMLEVVL
jgi:hypothetical protein